jgi:hypothetical protein
MTGPLDPRKVSPHVRAELEIAIAIARERLQEAHAAQLLELIHGADGQLAPRRATEISARLHYLGPELARNVGNKVLASLGQFREVSGVLPAPGRVDEGDPLTVFGQIRRRLRGRTNVELRRKVELLTGRAEVALMRVHVENVLRLLEAVGEESPVAQVVDAYAQILEVRKSVAEMVYFLTLDRLASPLSGRTDRPGVWNTPAPAIGEHTLRVISNPR